MRTILLDGELSWTASRAPSNPAVCGAKMISNHAPKAGSSWPSSTLFPSAFFSVLGPPTAMSPYGPFQVALISRLAIQLVPHMDHLQPR